MATHAAVLRSGWVGLEIDRFTLLEWLGATDNGDAFLAALPQPLDSQQQLALQPARRGVLLLVPADPATAQDQLRNWQSAMELDHPHLLRMLACGRTDVDDADYLYAVTELPEESLAEVLPTRSLTSDEAREMLTPIVEALACLHSRNLLHGRIDPSAVLVAEGRLKLSTDRVRTLGSLRGFDETLTIYDAPESKSEPLSAAADIWSLGITIVEALTQKPPAWIRSSGRSPLIPVDVPRPFGEIARACLRIEPAHRCTLDEVAALLGAAPAPAETPVAPAPTALAEAAAAPHIVPAAQPIAPAFEAAAPPSAPVAAPRPSPRQFALFEDADPSSEAVAHEDAQPFRRSMRGLDDDDRAPLAPRRYMQIAIAAAVILFLLIVGWAAYRHKGKSSADGASATAPTISAVADNAPAHSSAAQPAPQPSRPRVHASPVKGEVTHRVMPVIPARAERSIHGKVNVKIKALVDRSGEVTSASIQSPGRSRYFADQSLIAARKWRFKSARIDGKPAPSAWELRFEFRRDKTEATALETAP